MPPVVHRTPADARAWSDAERAAGHTLAAVPTMGALHDGHLRLVEVAGQHADRVVVSIFVNPLQFDRRDDFDAYPRALDDDLARCAAAGVHAVYAPSAAAMYPEGFDTRVEPGRLASGFEGEHRPGHFQGVATVVTKLLTAMRPHVAVFGRKDAQQLAVVRRLVADLDLGVRVVGVPTVREHDGLALSSRNALLDTEARTAAAAIPEALAAACRAARSGTTAAAPIERVVRDELARRPDVQLEYVRAVDRDSFDAVESVDERTLVVLAAWVGGVRLIDNVAVLDDPLPVTADDRRPR